MIEFAYPWLLLLLLLLPLIGVYCVYRQKQPSITVSTVAPFESVRAARRPGIPLTCMLLALGVTIVALARPRIGNEKFLIRSQGIDIVLAIDLSGSMAAYDVPPEIRSGRQLVNAIKDGSLKNRLDVAKDEIRKFIEARPNDRIGLIVFAGDAYMQLPITSDYVIARSFANSISPDMVSRQGTAIGAAINLAMNSFSSGSEGSRVLILISDGENHEDDALAAAAAAAAQGIKIYTIGIGTPEGAPISIGGEFIKDEQGNMVVSKLDEKTLQQIAVSTGGSYIRATNRSLGLNEIVKQINEVEKKELKTKVFEDFDEQFRGLLWAALGLLLIEGAMLTRKNRMLARFSVFKSSDHDLR